MDSSNQLSMLEESLFAEEKEQKMEVDEVISAVSNLSLPKEVYFGNKQKLVPRAVRSKDNRGNV
jgi:hypothetical protein